MAVRPERSRTDARIDRSRARLRQALVDLIARDRFDTITAAAIAKQAGLGYATFFRHYADPRAVLVEVADDLIDELTAEIAPFVLGGDDHALATTLVSFVAQRRPVCHALLIGAGDVVRQEITARAMRVAGTVGATPTADLPVRLAVAYGVGAVLTILTWWLDHPDESVDMPAVLKRLVFRPMEPTASD